MSDVPLIEVHRGVEIRHHWLVTTDSWYAHFDLPEKSGEQPTFQREVRRDMRPPLRAGKQEPLIGTSQSDVLKGAKSIIDSWLDN